MSNDSTYPREVGTFQDEATKRSVVILMREDMQFAATVDGHQLVSPTYSGLTKAIKETIRQGADLWKPMIFVSAKGSSLQGSHISDEAVFVSLGLSANLFWVAKIDGKWMKADWNHYNPADGRDERYEKRSTWWVGDQAGFDGRAFAWNSDLFFPCSQLLWATLTVTVENLSAIAGYLEASLANTTALEASANDPERDLAGLPFTAPTRARKE